MSEFLARAVLASLVALLVAATLPLVVFGVCAAIDTIEDLLDRRRMR